MNITTSNESKQQLAYYGIAVGIALIVLVGGYFTYVKPTSAQATVLKTRITRLNQEALSADQTYQSAETLSKVQLADLFDLTRAMPDQPQVADVLVVLGRIAHNSGVEFDSIKPDPNVPLAGYQAVPMEIALQGDYYDLMEFLYELRHLVDVRADTQGTTKLFATGRLFTVNKVDIEIAPTGDPNHPALTATIDLDAFVYGTGEPATTPTTTGTTTTTTTPSGTSAASAPAGGSS